MSSPRENPGECDSCHFPTRRLTLWKDQDTTIASGGLTAVKADFWYCELCSGTLAGIAKRFPGRYPDQACMGVVCYVGNLILTAIRRTENVPPEARSGQRVRK